MIEHLYRAQCDHCGERLDWRPSLGAALGDARKLGWKVDNHQVGGRWKMQCIGCWEKQRDAVPGELPVGPTAPSGNWTGD